MSSAASVPQTPPSSASSSAASSPAASPSAIGTITKDANGQPKKCRFNDCDNHAVDGTSKCAFHKNRRQCCVESCTNQVYARKLCVRHGGKKQCQADNCDAHARGGGFCLQHGGFVVKRFCIVEGCSKQAHARQKCVRHGGGRRCKVDACMQHARAGGLCNRHSHGHECRVDGCNKTAQHSGSICFRHAMEMRAHGEAVPELNISKGGRLSSKKRQQLQREQQLKQEQFHHQQLQQQQQLQSHHHVQHHHAQQQQQQSHLHQHLHQPQQQQPHPVQLQQQQQQQQATSQPQQQPTSSSTSSSSGPGPFGLPLKISVPTTMPKFSLRTPLGGNGFPTPRTHDFSLLMGLPSPQIDTSQLPSVLAMSNANNSSSGANGAQRPLYEPPTPLTASLFGLSGPPSITRGGSRNMFGMFPTSDKTGHGHGDEDIDSFINGYKFMPPEAASPITYHHHANQYAMPPLLDNIGLNVFESNAHHAVPHPHVAAMNARNQLHASQGQPQQQHLQRFASAHTSGGGHFDPAYVPPQSSSSSSSGPSEANSHDYTAQFFADGSGASLGKSDLNKTGRALKASAPVPKPTGVTAA